MSIQFPSIKKNFQGPLESKYVTTIDLDAVELKPGNILLLRGEASTSRNMYLKILCKNVNPDTCGDTVPSLNASVKCKDFFSSNPNKIKKCELQLSEIGKTFLKTSNVYIFDEPCAFLNEAQSLEVALSISNFITKNNKIGIISSNNAIMMSIADNIIDFPTNNFTEV